jgi:hypothetical protein
MASLRGQIKKWPDQKAFGKLCGTAESKSSRRPGKILATAWKIADDRET